MARTRSQPNHNDDLYFPNDVRIQEVSIIVGGEIFDVQRLLLQINLFEDLYSNTLSGSITLVDSVNLIGNAPFVGQEQFKLVFETPGFPSAKKLDLEFDIYKISDRNTGHTGDLTHATQTYTLHFVSSAYFANKQNRIRQAYTNLTISDMVKTIGSQIGIEIATEPTSGSQSFIIPGWNPFYAINWLANRARPATNPHAANYFFFEGLDGFNFMSLNHMVTRRPLVKYVYDIANQRLLPNTAAPAAKSGNDRQIMPEIRIMRNYQVIESGTTLDRVDSGMYASKLITHDLVRKKFCTFDFAYFENFKQLQHIEDFKSDDQGKRIEQDARAFAGFSKHGDKIESAVRFYPKHSFMHDGIADHDESQKWLLQRMSQLKAIEQLRLRVELPGDSNCRVGDVVIVEVPRPEFIKGYAYPDNRDPNISGNYLITNVHHIIELDNHRMIMELSKESLPPTSNESVIDKQDTATGVFGAALTALSDKLNSGAVLLKNIFK